MGRLHGMKLARRCPVVSHLLFADDSLFFLHATMEDVECVTSIFDQYERISGQKVNYDTCSIISGKRIPQPIRLQIHHLLKIHLTCGGSKYLGLPEQFNCIKVSDFQGIVSNVKN